MQGGQRISDSIAADEPVSGYFVQYCTESSRDSGIVAISNPVSLWFPTAMAGNTDPGKAGFLVDQLLGENSHLSQGAWPGTFQYDISLFYEFNQCLLARFLVQIEHHRVLVPVQ